MGEFDERVKSWGIYAKKGRKERRIFEEGRVGENSWSWTCGGE